MGGSYIIRRSRLIKRHTRIEKKQCVFFIFIYINRGERVIVCFPLLVVIDVDVAFGADVVAARVAVFVFIVLGGVEAIGAEARHFAAGAPAAIHEERLAAPGALLLRFTCSTDNTKEKEKNNRFNNRSSKPIKQIRYAKYQISRTKPNSPLLSSPTWRALSFYCITARHYDVRRSGFYCAPARLLLRRLIVIRLNKFQASRRDSNVDLVSNASFEGVNSE